MTIDGPKSRTAEEIATEIVQRCQTLLTEMGQLRQQLFALHGENQHISGLATQISSISTEKAAAESYLKSLNDGNAPWRGNAEARFRSNNIPAVEQIWNIIKKCRYVTSVQHRVVVNPKTSGGPETIVEGPKSRQKEKPSVMKEPVVRKGVSDEGIWINAVVEGVRTVL